MKTVSRVVVRQRLACLAGAVMLRLLWGAVGRSFPLWLAGCLGAAALATSLAYRLPVGPDKYEIVSFLDRWTSRLGPSVLLFMALAGLEGLARQAWEFVFLIRYPFTVNVLDGREPSKAWLLLHGLGVYPPLDGSQLLVTLYNPLYHIVLAGLFTAIRDIFAVARILNAVLAAILLAIVWRLSSVKGGTWKMAGLVTALFALSGPFRVTSFTRPDVLAWVLAFGGLVLAGQAREEPGGGSRNLAAGILLGLAYLAKQQSLPFFLGTCLWLALSWRCGALWRVAAGFCGTAGLGLLAEGLLTHGAVFEHTVSYPGLIASNPAITSTWRGGAALWNFLLGQCPLMLAWASTIPGRKGFRDVRLEEVVFLVNIPFLIVLLGTWGADANYLLSGLGLLCVLGARALASLWKRGHAQAVVCAALLAALLPGAFPCGDMQRNDQALEKALEQRKALVRAVLDEPGRILADVEGAPAFLDSVPLENVTLYDAVELGAYAWAIGGTLTESVLLRDIKARRFGLVVNGATLHSREYTLVLHRYYVRTQVIGPYELLKPRPALAVLELEGLSEAKAAGQWKGGEAGVSARVTEARNLVRVAGRDCWCLGDKREEAVLGLEVQAPRDHSLTYELGLPAMLSAPGGSVEPLAGPNDAELAPVAGFGAVGVKNFDEVWNEPTRMSGTWPGGELRLLVRMRGNAVLCMNRDNPAWLVVGPTR
ncbi:hypothetical protein [Solidesulfovibrio alcoholivorans]|uniref:hypothetical protein n=1 Tax=Solidesulfovibrio alcoholivorans TaxID=81406 RepID=UPI0005C1DB7D|nr:hypothetical protein [Solidesulfovibrio alcoholivorans]